MNFLFLPLTALLALVRRRPVPSILAGCAVALLSFVTHHAAIGAGIAMCIGMIVVWLDETRTPRQPEQGVASGD